MNARSSKQIVVASVLLTSGIILYDLRGLPPFRTAFALAVLFLFLSFLADVAPEIAGPFALLLLVSVATARKEGVTFIRQLSGDPEVAKGG